MQDLRPGNRATAIVDQRHVLSGKGASTMIQSPGV
jgi:hypothetical protein